MDDLTLRYRGYEGSVAVSLDDRVLHGRVLFVNDLVSYEGATVPELEASFREAVDAYLELSTDKPATSTLAKRSGDPKNDETTE